MTTDTQTCDDLRARIKFLEDSLAEHIEPDYFETGILQAKAAFRLGMATGFAICGTVVWIAMMLFR